PEPAAVRPARAAPGRRGAALLAAHPATCDAVAGLLGCDGTWQTTEPGPVGAALVARHPQAALAWEALLAGP
ncbi:hypothetical protein, partial [Streptomyces sp. NPDC003077]|uniref:hypothetical protein n=1 Tax=Streptomyces sp. NPDC003077 TaxID=3154443 RepID=UPI0033A3E27B